MIKEDICHQKTGKTNYKGIKEYSFLCNIFEFLKTPVHYFPHFPALQGKLIMNQCQEKGGQMVHSSGSQSLSLGTPVRHQKYNGNCSGNSSEI